MAKPFDQSICDLVEAIKALNKPRYERYEPTFSPNRDINDYPLYTKFKKDFAYFIADIEVDNWEDKVKWLLRSHNWMPIY